MVGPLPQSAEGGLERGRDFPPCHGPAGGSAEGASNETEIACASRGLDRAPSSEAEIAPRLARPRRGRTVVPGRGPSVGLPVPEEASGVQVWEGTGLGA